MGRKKLSTAVSTSSGMETMTSMIPYFGISSSFENLEDWIADSTATSSLHSDSSPPSQIDPITQPQSKHPSLMLLTPSPPLPITPISSKRRNSVHNQQRKSRSRIIHLLTAISPTEKNISKSPISPLSSSCHSVSSHFPLKSPRGTQNSPHSCSNSSKGSQGSKRSVPPELECADYMDVPKVSSKITGDWAKSRALKLALNSDDDDFASDLKNLITQVCDHNPKEPSKILAHFPAALKLLLQLHRELKCPPQLHESFWIAHRSPSHANLATILSRVIQLAESRVLLFDLLKACMGNPSPKLLSRMLEDSKKKQEEKVANADLFARLNYFGQSSDQIRARARATTAYSFSSENSVDSTNGLPKDLDELRILIRGSSQNGGSNNGNGSSGATAVRTVRTSQILKPSQMIQLPGTSPSGSASGSASGDQKPSLKRFASSKVPSMEMITEDGDEEEEEEDGEEWEPGQDEDEEDEGWGDAEEESPTDSNSNEVDERMRQESIRKFVQARFSGRESSGHLATTATALTPTRGALTSQFPSFASSACDSFCSKDDLPPSSSQPASHSSTLPHPPSIPSPPPRPRPTLNVAANGGNPNSSQQPPLSPSMAPRHRSSKRVSMQCVHPKLLEKICHEWMESVPWQVHVFICDQRTIATSPSAKAAPSKGVV